MKKNNSINFIWLIYIIIFEVSAFNPVYSNKLMLLLMLFNIIVTLIRKKNGLFTMLSSFIMCNEVIALINFLCILLITSKLNKNETKIGNTKILLLLIVANSIISAAISNTYINVIFSMGYLSLILFIVSKLEINTNEDGDIKNYVKRIVILEFFVFLSLLFKYRLFIPGDSNYGTLMNAHLFGNLLIIIIIYLIGTKNILENIKKNIVYLILCLIMLYFSDSKALLASVAILILLIPIIKLLQNKNRNTIFKVIILIYISLYIAIPVMKLNFVEQFVRNNASGVYKYIYDNKYNYKYQYFDGTLYKELTGYRMLIGFGLGQYGSRFANLFTYDVSYRTDNFLNTFVKNNFKPHYNQNYIKYISFYNNDFVTGIQWRSAILSYPFNSLIAIIGEIGWIGLIIFALFIESKYKTSKYKNILYYFLLTCLFENNFDMFLSLGLVIFFLSIKDSNLLGSTQEKKYKYSIKNRGDINEKN